MNTEKVLLRVGMDLGFGGLGPIFPDGTFEYVPIPDNPWRVSDRSLYFRDLPARSGGGVACFVPRKYVEGPAHNDPEFGTFTYGDPSKIKRGQLLRLSKGDMLVFYAGLRPPEQRLGSNLFIIGYFVVKHVHEVTNMEPWPPPALAHLWGNAHFRRSNADQHLVIVEGAQSASRLLSHAIPLSDTRQEVLPNMTKMLGISGSVKRAGAGRWVPPSHVQNVARWLSTL